MWMLVKENNKPGSILQYLFIKEEPIKEEPTMRRIISKKKQNEMFTL